MQIEFESDATVTIPEVDRFFLCLDSWVGQSLIRRVG